MTRVKINNIRVTHRVNGEEMTRPIDKPHCFRENPHALPRLAQVTFGSSVTPSSYQYLGDWRSHDPEFEMSGTTTGYACWNAPDMELLWRLAQATEYLMSIERDAPDTWPVRRVRYAERLLPGGRLTRAMEQGHEDRHTDLLLDLMLHVRDELDMSLYGAKLVKDPGSPVLDSEDHRALTTLLQDVKSTVTKLQDLQKAVEVLLATNNLALEKVLT